MNGFQITVFHQVSSEAFSSLYPSRLRLECLRSLLSESVQRTLQHPAEADSGGSRTLTSRRLCIQRLSEAGCRCFSGGEHTLHWVCRAERVAPPHAGHRRFDTRRLSDIHTNEIKRRCNRHANRGSGPCGSPGEALSLLQPGL